MDKNQKTINIYIMKDNEAGSEKPEAKGDLARFLVASGFFIWNEC